LQRYCKDNPGRFGNADAAYVLSFAIIMLNTDAHNPLAGEASNVVVDPSSAKCVCQPHYADFCPLLAAHACAFLSDRIAELQHQCVLPSCTFVCHPECDTNTWRSHKGCCFRSCATPQLVCIAARGIIHVVAELFGLQSTLMLKVITWCQFKRSCCARQPPLQWWLGKGDCVCLQVNHNAYAASLQSLSRLFYLLQSGGWVAGHG
jgi:hypothetical protein